nr:hypothetical protein [Tanacetum cinerariifolium]
QAIDCGAEAADLDELRASLPYAHARRGGCGGCGGGDPEGVLGGGGGIVVVVMTAEVVDVDVRSREPDYDVVRSIIGVVIGGTDELSSFLGFCIEDRVPVELAASPGFDPSWHSSCTPGFGPAGLHHDHQGLVQPGLHLDLQY